MDHLLSGLIICASLTEQGNIQISGKKIFLGIYEGVSGRRDLGKRSTPTSVLEEAASDLSLFVSWEVHLLSLDMRAPGPWAYGIGLGVTPPSALVLGLQTGIELCRWLVLLHQLAFNMLWISSCTSIYISYWFCFSGGTLTSTHTLPLLMLQAAPLKEPLSFPFYIWEEWALNLHLDILLANSKAGIRILLSLTLELEPDPKVWNYFWFYGDWCGRHHLHLNIFR